MKKISIMFMSFMLVFVTAMHGGISVNAMAPDEAQTTISVVEATTAKDNWKLWYKKILEWYKNAIAESERLYAERETASDGVYESTWMDVQEVVKKPSIRVEALCCPPVADGTPHEVYTVYNVEVNGEHFLTFRDEGSQMTQGEAMNCIEEAVSAYEGWAASYNSSHSSNPTVSLGTTTTALLDEYVDAYSEWAETVANN